MDGASILVGIAVVVVLAISLAVVALYLGGKKTLTDLGDRAWRWMFGVKDEPVAAPAPAPAASPSEPQTVKLAVEHEPAAPARPLTPQLPDPVPDFTGHEDKVRQLVERLRNRQGAAITAIGGQGGAGKTEMAYYVASQLRDVYPGGQVQLDLRGLDDKPLTPEQAMTDVIVALEPGLKPPDQPSQIAGLYHGLLSERKVLILADNAKDSGQVRPLAPKPPSALLVTSRQTIQVAGVERVDLEQLDPPDAHTLLRSILDGKEASNAEIERLAELCAFLPLALRVAGNRLAGSPALAVASYLDQLAKGSGVLRFEGRDVMAVLTESVEALEREDEALAGKWRSLAVFPAPFGRPAAEAVGEFEDDELDRLLARTLVLYDAKEDRFRLHDLMRELASQGLGAEDRLQTGKRHSRHYLEVAGRANDTYLHGREEVLEGLRLFDRERVQIEAGQSWAAEHADSDDDAAVLAQDYPLRAANVLELRHYPRDRIGWLQTSSEAARRLGNREPEGMALGNLGIACVQLGEPKRAIEYYEQVLTIARETGDRRSEGMALGTLGIAYRQLGEPKRAIEYYEQHVTIARETGHQRGEGNALGNLGLAYADLGQPKRAIEYYEQHLAIARETGDRRGEGNALGNLGLVNADLGEPKRAIEYFEQVLTIARETGDRRGGGMTLGNLGNAYLGLGEPKRAIEYYEQHVAIARETEDRRGEGTALGTLGLAYADLGEPKRAIEYFKRQLPLARETGDRRGEGNALWNRALAFDELGRRQEAISGAQAALAIYEQIEDPNAEVVRRKLAACGAAP